MNTIDERSNLTMAKFQAMVDNFGQLSRYNGVRVYGSKLHPKHPTRKYKAYYQAHPFVVRLCWALRRWVRILPYVTAEYPDDGDAYYLRDYNTMIMGERHYKLFKEGML